MGAWSRVFRRIAPPASGAICCNRASITGYEMREAIIGFFSEEDSGAVTVDWVVMTAIVTALGTSVAVVFIDGDSPIGAATAEALTRATND